MRWRDRGFILVSRSYGEGGFILEVLTQAHGYHLGFTRASMRRRAGLRRNILLSGNLVHLWWQARLDEHLGMFRVELERSVAPFLMDDRFALEGLSALCGLARLLPERQPVPDLFVRFASLLTLLTGSEAEVWLVHFARFELALLRELGFGIEREDLPDFLTRSDSVATAGELGDSLAMMDGVLEERVCAPTGKVLPQGLRNMRNHVKA